MQDNGSIPAQNNEQTAPTETAAVTAKPNPIDASISTVVPVEIQNDEQTKKDMKKLFNQGKACCCLVICCCCSIPLIIAGIVVSQIPALFGEFAEM